MMHKALFNWQLAVDLAGGDEDLLLLVLQQFLSEAPFHRSKLQQAVAQRVLADITFHAHTLKGLLSTFGANEASAAARRLEQLAKQGDSQARIEYQYQQFEEQLSELMPQLEQLLKN